MQKLLQNKLQAQQQGTSHEILYSLLYTAELYALGKEGNRRFKAYEIANSSKKSKDKIRNSLLIKCDSFKNSLLFFKHDWGKYEFPDNLKSKEIIAFLENWKNKVEKEDKFIYQNLINLISENKYESLNYQPNNYSKGHANDIQMGNMVNIFNKIMYSNNLLDKKIMENVDKNGIFKGEAILDYNQSIDPILGNINPYINQQIDGVDYPQEIEDDIII